MSAMYVTQATATGGREGRAVSGDGKLEVELDLPAELGGKGKGTNPEQLFAAGYAACFESAMRLTARKDGIRPKNLSVTASVALHKTADGEGFELAVQLSAASTELSDEQLTTLMDAAHAICPYSNATRGNIDVSLSLSAADPSA